MSTTPTPTPTPAPTPSQAIAAVKTDISNLDTATKAGIQKLIADAEAAGGVSLAALKTLFGL